jgi:hypothetical protein
VLQGEYPVWNAEQLMKLCSLHFRANRTDKDDLKSIEVTLLAAHSSTPLTAGAGKLVPERLHR